MRIAKDVASLLEPVYGIGYRRIFGWGPSFYAIGLSFGDSPDDEPVSQWIEAQENKLYHFLRDVYPWNFLTAPQLTAKVGKLTLQNWIEQGRGRGSLTPVSDKMLLWSVEDKNIPEIRKKLLEAGVVFDYDKYMDEKYPPEEKEPLTGEEALGEVLQAYGYQSPDEVQILETKGQGRFEELSEQKIRRIIEAAKKRPRKK